MYTRDDGLASEDRGQMEVLGFVIIFGVVVAAIAILAITGFAGLNDLRDAEKANNAVRVFDILDDNIDDLVTGDAPHRATEVSLTDSQLSLGKSTNVTVSGELVANPSVNFTYSEAVRPIEYAVTQDTTLLYVAGSVIRDDRGASVMLEGPDLLFSPEAVNIPIVQTRPSIYQADVGGSRSVNVRTELVGRERLVADPRPYTVTLSVTSPHASSWERYFERLEAGSVVRTGDTVSVTVQTERVYVNTVQVDVNFE